MTDTREAAARKKLEKSHAIWLTTLADFLENQYGGENSDSIQLRQIAAAIDSALALIAEGQGEPVAPDFWIYQSDSGYDDQVLDGDAGPIEGFDAVYLAPPSDVAREALERIRDAEYGLPLAYTDYDELRICRSIATTALAKLDGKGE